MIKVSFVMEHIWIILSKDYNLKTNFAKNGGLLESSLIKVCYVCV